MNLTLEVLSPVHIGDGTKIDNWSYVCDEKNKTISVYRFDEVVLSLKNNQYKLSALVSKIEREPLSNDLKDFINKDLKPLYTLRYEGKVKKSNKSNELEYKSIWSFIKVGNKVYIPGSEIKGAIRTAIFYHILKNNQKLKDELLNEIKKVDFQKDVKKQVEKISKKFEEKVFSKGKDDGKLDFMKFISVSDTNTKNPQECLYITDVEIINTSRNFKELHEVLKNGQTFEFNLNILWNKLYEHYINLPFKDLKSLKEVCNEFAYDLINHEEEYFKTTKENLNFDFDKLKNTKDGFLLRIGKHQGFLSLTVGLILKNSDKELFGKMFEKIAKKGYRNNPAKSRKLTINKQPLGWVKLNGQFWVYQIKDRL